MNSIISVKELSKSFTSEGTNTLALASVNLEIKKGEIFGLLGPNGAGKTTLIAILCGFLTPDKGTAEIFGMNCTNETEKIQKKINFVSGFSWVSEFFTVEELLHFYCLLYNLDNKKQRIENAIKLTDLEEHRKKRAEDLSSGLTRRFLISKSLLNDPEVLLLDEPTVGLDVDSSDKMRESIKEMKSKGKTILLTTHNMREAEELCDRIALINEGKIIAIGTFKELKNELFPLTVIDISTPEPDKLEKVISKMKFVNKIISSKNKLKIYLENKGSLNDVMKKLCSSGVLINAINTVEPELEHVYKKLIEV